MFMFIQNSEIIAEGTFASKQEAILYIHKKVTRDKDFFINAIDSFDGVNPVSIISKIYGFIKISSINSI